MRNPLPIFCLAFAILIVSSGHSFALPDCDTNKNPGSWNDCIGSHIIDGYGVPDAIEFEGEWRNGRMNGQGTRTHANGFEYVGEFKDDKFHGQGTMTLASGSTYVGEFKNGGPNGQGTFTHANGNQHIGQFKHGRAQGQGTRIESDGSKYVGGFHNNQLWGQGRITMANGTEFIGGFKYGYPDGRGTFSFPNRGKFTALFKNGLPYGKVNLTHANGNKFIGEVVKKLRPKEPDILEHQPEITAKTMIAGWKNIRLKGTLTFDPSSEFARNKYVGGLSLRGEFHGLGIYSWRNGSKYAGYWEEDARKGEGIYLKENGVIQEGIWDGEEFEAQKVSAVVHNLFNSVHKKESKNPPSNISKRLETLKKLLDQGLISEEEAAAKRKMILDSL